PFYSVIQENREGKMMLMRKNDGKRLTRIFGSRAMLAAGVACAATTAVHAGSVTPSLTLNITENVIRNGPAGAPYGDSLSYTNSSGVVANLVPTIQPGTALTALNEPATLEMNISTYSFAAGAGRSALILTEPGNPNKVSDLILFVNTNQIYIYNLEA